MTPHEIITRSIYDTLASGKGERPFVSYDSAKTIEAPTIYDDMVAQANKQATRVIEALKAHGYVWIKVNNPDIIRGAR